MPTCTRGITKKTVSGTVTIKLGSVEVGTIDLSDREHRESWNTCRCEEGDYVERSCITATQSTRDESVTGAYEPTRGLRIEWDLTVDTERDITNCEYDCVVTEDGSGSK